MRIIMDKYVEEEWKGELYAHEKIFYKGKTQIDKFNHKQLGILHLYIHKLKNINDVSCKNSDISNRLSIIETELKEIGNIHAIEYSVIIGEFKQFQEIGVKLLDIGVNEECEKELRDSIGSMDRQIKHYGFCEEDLKKYAKDKGLAI